MQEQDNKDIIYAKGTIKNFLVDDSPATLYFDGEDIQSGERIKRKIKLSKRVRGYNKEGKLIAKKDYPRPEEVYNGRLIIESWLWEGKNCMRVLDFEVAECLGEHRPYNPFDEFGKIEDEIENFSLI